MSCLVIVARDVYPAKLWRCKPDISLTKNVIVFSSESKFFSPYQHFLDPETFYATGILGYNL